MNQALSERLHAVARRFGRDVVRFPGARTSLGRRIALLRWFRVDLVLDVGANVGQYGRELREIGYRGRIISFEPLPQPYRRLASAAHADRDWASVNVALGDFDGEVKMHVAANSYSSSILEMLPSHLRAAPDSAYVDDATVTVRRLDGLVEPYLQGAHAPFLKIDVQGFEQRVLAGAGQTLPRLIGLQVELSLETLYAGATSMDDMLSAMRAAGFTLVGIEPGFTDAASGRLLQADGIFFRLPEAEALARSGGGRAP